jgi:hypothetical protein
MKKQIKLVVKRVNDNWAVCQIDAASGRCVINASSINKIDAVRYAAACERCTGALYVEKKLTLSKRGKSYERYYTKTARSLDV